MIKGRGELWVAMLDTKAAWDGLVRTHAPSLEDAYLEIVGAGLKDA